MSDYKYETDYLEVGDEFSGGPIEQSYFISAVMAVGGEVEIDGNKVVILQLPKKEFSKAKAPVTPVADQKAAVAPVAEEPPIVDLASEEAVVEEAPAPIHKVKLSTRKPIKPSIDSPVQSQERR